MEDHMEAHNLLEIKELSKSYGDFALRNVNLAVPAGAIVGLVGVNGAGKTTLMKCALSLVKPDSGSIALFGEEVVGAPDSHIAQLHERIGVVFDALPFPNVMTARAVGKCMAKAYPTWESAKYDCLIDAFGLPADKAVKDFSRGMGMKLQLACALSHGPELLLLDEATAGLDPIAREEVLDALADSMTDGRGILMSSHITSDLERIADYIVCIDEGRVVFALEKSVICDRAGIAHCRTRDLEAVRASGMFADGGVRLMQRATEVSLLVPDRFAFAKAFPSVVTERADIDTYINMTLKGETL